MKTTAPDKNAKRPYEPPRLRVIDLTAEEVLAVGCKVWMGPRGFRNPAPSCAVPRNCFGPGT